jgi:hypothetical protein
VLTKEVHGSFLKPALWLQREPSFSKPMAVERCFSQQAYGSRCGRPLGGSGAMISTMGLDMFTSFICKGQTTDRYIKLDSACALDHDPKLAAHTPIDNGHSQFLAPYPKHQRAGRHLVLSTAVSPPFIGQMYTTGARRRLLPPDAGLRIGIRSACSNILRPNGGDCP